MHRKYIYQPTFPSGFYFVCVTYVFILHMKSEVLRVFFLSVWQPFHTILINITAIYSAILLKILPAAGDVNDSFQGSKNPVHFYVLLHEYYFSIFFTAQLQVYNLKLIKCITFEYCGCDLQGAHSLSGDVSN